MSPSQIDLSIVVPCRNEAAHIRGFFECLFAQDLDSLTWEVIVADGMSTDGTRQMLEEYCNHSCVRCVDNPKGTVSAGLNRAIRQARGEFILRMDMHTVYAPNYVEQCLDTLQKTGADNVGGPWHANGRGRVGRAVGAAFHSRFCVGGARAHDLDYEGPVDTVYLGCWRKATLERLGLFDEDLVRNQDDELNLRIIRAGGKIWQSPRIRSWYSPRNSLRALAAQYFQYGFWKVAVIRKHRFPASWRHLVPGAFVLANLVFPLAALTALTFGSWQICAWLARSWAIMLLTYVVLCCLASFKAPRRHGADLLPILPLVFACYHLSYGLGFLNGLMYLARGRKFASPGSLYTEITR